jgi:PAS domain S-box-containing protein
LWAIFLSVLVLCLALWWITEQKISEADEPQAALRQAVTVELTYLSSDVHEFNNMVLDLMDGSRSFDRRSVTVIRDSLLVRLKTLKQYEEQTPGLELGEIPGIRQHLLTIYRRTPMLSDQNNDSNRSVRASTRALQALTEQLIKRRSDEDAKLLASNQERRAVYQFLIRSVSLILIALLAGAALVLRRLSMRSAEMKIRHRTQISDIDVLLEHKEVERVAAESALKQSEARFKEFAESASDWFWEYDAEFRFTQVGPRFFEIAKIEPDQMIGKTREEIEQIKVGGKEEAWARHRQCLVLHQPFRHFEYEVMGRDGRPRWISISGMPRFDDHGQFLGYRGTGLDVTALRLADEELKKLNRTLETRVSARTEELLAEKERAEHASFAKSEFLANMSHELRTPLNAINGFSQIMKDEMFGPHSQPKYADYARDINAASSHLLALITDILDVSKVESGEFNLEENILDIENTISACLRLINEKARKKSIYPQVLIDPRVPRIHGDERIIKQILINLLSNAVKFTDNDGRISVKTVVNDDNCLTLSINDNGSGIKNRDLDRVLEPFAQVRESSEIAHEGTGLGLPLAKRFMEMHGGKLMLESQIGIGTTVILVFPARRSILRQDAENVVEAN